MNLDASPALSVLCTGEFSIIRSSIDFAWSGFRLERQLASVGMRLNDHSDQNILALVSSPIMRGELDKKSGTASIRKTAGHVTAIPKGPVPQMRVTSETELVYCSFDGDFIEQVAADVRHFRPERLVFRSRLQDKSLRLLMQMLVSEFDAGNPTGRLYAETLAEALALRFLHLATVSPVESSVRVAVLSANRLARVKDFVESSIDQDITLDSLAREIGYSRAHFLRTFRKSTGTTPYQYVMQRRIAHAEELLSSNKLGLAAIALACGFSSQAHFTLAFKKQTGLTPAEYRRIQ
jgi:AraC family transcriptional regulator